MIDVHIYKEVDCVIYAPWETTIEISKIKVDQSLLDRWKACRDEYAALQRIFLGLYNIQMEKSQNEG